MWSFQGFKVPIYGLQGIDSIVGRPWGAVILKSFKTAPKIQPKSRKNCEKSSWNCKNHQNSFQKPAQKLEKMREKVAETAEISKTAPKTSLKAGKIVRKSKSSWNDNGGSL